jgi:microcystin-dependent protein
MAEPFIGEIKIFTFNFVPRGYGACNGQLLPIAQNTALFSILGITYGGNGQTTFALPNLIGRAPIHVGQGPGLSQYDLGQNGGTADVTLTAAELPMHSHNMQVASDAPTSGAPSPANVLAGAAIYGPAQNLVPMASLGASPQAHNNRQPYLTLNFCIALQGYFPSRN